MKECSAFPAVPHVFDDVFRLQQMGTACGLGSHPTTLKHATMRGACNRIHGTATEAFCDTERRIRGMHFMQMCFLAVLQKQSIVCNPAGMTLR